MKSLVQVNMQKDEVNQKAVQFFSSKNYSIISTTESSVAFEDGKDISTGILVLGILFLLIGAILYYLLAKKHQVTITYSEITNGTSVNCSTNSSKALKDSQDFLQTIS